MARNEPCVLLVQVAEELRQEQVPESRRSIDDMCRHIPAGRRCPDLRWGLSFPVVQDDSMDGLAQMFRSVCLPDAKRYVHRANSIEREGPHSDATLRLTIPISPPASLSAPSPNLFDPTPPTWPSRAAHLQLLPSCPRTPPTSRYSPVRQTARAQTPPGPPARAG